MIDTIRDLRHHRKQAEYEHSKQRMNMVVGGRRTLKSSIAIRRLYTHALQNTEWPDWRGFFGGPTWQQAKDVGWNKLKDLSNRSLINKISESELYIKYYNGAEIHIEGMDKPARVEGQPWNECALDEFQDMKRDVFPEHVRPALTDRLGGCDFLIVPEGRNFAYDMWLDAVDDDEWARFHWTTEEILPVYLGKENAAREIASAKSMLDDATYDQEYNASFVMFEGRAYYNFDEEIHCKPVREKYNKKFDLIFAFDFNISPGTATVIQEHGGITCVIGEVFIPQNSTTPNVCRKLIQDWGGHQGTIYCYGDATGGAKGSGKVEGSDWDIIKSELRQKFKNVYYRVKKSNPKERPRINSVNSRLKSADGKVRMYIDPTHAPNVIRCFNGTALLKGGSGEIDKKSDSRMSHMTDEIGYYTDYEFPTRIRSGVFTRSV